MEHTELTSNKTVVKLKRHVTFFSGFSFVAGIIIGSGIFASPKVVMENSGSVGLGLIIWALCGVLSIMAALCYLELALMMPESGSDYVYLKKAFGKLPAFVWLMMFSFIIQSASACLVSITFGNYVVQAFHPGCSGNDKEKVAKVLALFALGMLYYIVNILFLYGLRR